MKSVTFGHTGHIGDVLYSCYFVREFMASEPSSAQARLHLRTGVEVASKLGAHSAMTEKDTEFLLPFLEKTGIFSGIAVSGDPIEVEEEDGIDLSAFRHLPMNAYAGDIRAWYYNLSDRILPMNFYNSLCSNRLLHSSSRFGNELADKLVFAATLRYQNLCLNYAELKPFADKMVFMGTEYEHKFFCKHFFELPHRPVKDALEAAELMLGSRGVVSNPSGLYAIAECVKAPRILLTPEWVLENGKPMRGPVNVIPQGGKCVMAQVQKKMLSAVAAFLA